MTDFAMLCKSKKVALQFSGGKDSLVLLHMMQPYWADLAVYYVNSGDSFPETDELIAAVKSLVPNFIEVQGRKPLVEQVLGWPSDILTSSSSDFGHALGEVGPKLVDRYKCCFHSLMEPMHERMRSDGIEVILRGQRNSDKFQSPVRSGDIVDGFAIIFPLADLTEEQVFAYLDEHNIPVPRFYTEGMTSGGDCMTCTAWLEHRQAKYLNKFHPQTAKLVFQRLAEIKRATDEKYERLLRAQEE